jgi:hypothetical protein
MTVSLARGRRRVGLSAALVALLFSLGAPAASKKPASKKSAAAQGKHTAASKRPAARQAKSDRVAARPEPPLPKVAPLDYSRVKIQDFADEELDLPFYLVHLHELANGIDDQGPTRGFMRLGVWRATQKPYNARVMENILSLAWFYTAKRPWNQYYNDPALRARLEAALDFWCRSQASDGTFTEYGPRDFSLSPTAFATKFIGETMGLLRGAPLDEKIRARAMAALRRAVIATLTNISFYADGRNYTNQFGNVWGGGLAMLTLAPDKALRVFLESRFRGCHDDFQSPAGFFYESGGPDWGYTLGTHGSNMAQAYKYMRGTRLEPILLEGETRWMDWLAWNAVPEPDGGFILNRSIESRRQHAAFASYESPFADKLPSARALSESSEERSVRLAHLRGKLVATFPRVPALQLGDTQSFSPYAFLNRDVADFYPPTKDRDAARALLPSIAPGSVISRRHDPRMPATFTFVRRPTYYAAFAAGKKSSGQQRFGLGLFFNPGYGAVLQSQTKKTREESWGTAVPRGDRNYESEDLEVTYTRDGKPLPEAADGVEEVPAGTLGIEYKLGKSGQKTVAFTERALDVTVTLPGEIVETLPLLVVANENVVLSKGKARVQSKTGSCEVRFDDTVEPKVGEADERVLTKRLVTLTLSSRDKLAYSVTCNGRRKAP